MLVNYPANTRQWKIGDHVIHDKDEKIASMLMIVKGYDKQTGQCITVYVYPDYLPVMRGRFRNDLRVLHDPAQFGIVTKREVV